MGAKYETVDGENMAHLSSCEGCPECEWCAACGMPGHKSHLAYIPAYGEYLCDSCKDEDDARRVARGAAEA